MTSSEPTAGPPPSYYYASGSPDLSLVGVVVFFYGILLILHRFGVAVPDWLLTISNPIAWLANILGATEVLGDVWVTLHQFISYLPSKLGIPIIGTLLLWFFITFKPPRGENYHFLFVVVPGCIALQFSLQGAYLTQAERWRERGDVMREEDALSKVIHLAQRMRTPKIFDDSDHALATILQLDDLWALPQLSGRSPQAKPITLSVGSIEVTIRGNLRPFPYPQLAKHHHAFDAFRETLKRVTPASLKLSDLGRLTVMDGQFYLGMVLASDIVGLGALLNGYEFTNANAFLSTPMHLDVVLHTSQEDLLASLNTSVNSAQLSGVAGQVVAYYSPSRNTLHVAMSADEYRRTARQGLAQVFSGGPSMSGAGVDALTLLSRSMYEPLAHELWHFAAEHVASLDALPAALDEGMAVVFASLVAAVDETAAANPGLFDSVGPRGSFRDPVRENSLRRLTPNCSRDQQSWRRLVLDAALSGTLVATSTLLSLDGVGLANHPRSRLLYAESWVLAVRLIPSKALMDSVLTAHSRLTSGSQRLTINDAVFWRRIDSEIAGMATIMCQ